MKSRWQKQLEAAVAAYDTPMPWARGEQRKSMILRRQSRENAKIAQQKLKAQST